MKVRTCKGETLYTGVSKCPIDRDKIVGAIVVQHGHKLPATLSGNELEHACHADGEARIIPIKEFVEYAKNGGEVNVSATGYGPNKATDMSAWTDAFTLDDFNENVNSSLLKTLNSKYDVYFYDRSNVVYGMDDGTDQLAGFPMACIYPTSTPYPTSGAKPSLVVNFCYQDGRVAMEKTNYEQADFNIGSFVYGLTPVKVVSTGSNKYKIVEAVGGLDRTADFGSAISGTPSSVIESPATGISYADGEITSSAEIVLKSPSALYDAGIKGMVAI